MMISIIVPIYNSAGTLRSCLNSIINQNYKDYEIVLVNDGSNDESTKICAEYVYRHKNIKYFYQANCGVAASRKRGVELASGKYIMFVDSDDTITANLLHNIANAVMVLDLDIVRYQANLINDDEVKDHNRYNFVSEVYTVRSGIESIKLWTEPKKKYAVYWLFAFRRSLFSTIDFPNLRCYEDVAYIPILIALAKRVMTIDCYGYNYTCNRQDSLTNNYAAYYERAYDFYNAFNFATSNFSKLPGVTKEDIEFFNQDYIRRLKGFYSGMPTEMQDKFKEMYAI